MGYQTNTLVYGPGGYRFMDYVRVGLPLNLLLLVVVSFLVPLLWS
jgi:di/tricarboxylate transporter